MLDSDGHAGFRRQGLSYFARRAIRQARLGQIIFGIGEMYIVGAPACRYQNFRKQSLELKERVTGHKSDVLIFSSDGYRGMGSGDNDVDIRKLASLTLASSKTKAILCELLARDELLVLPGVYAGISARIAFSEGFDALYMTGAGTSASESVLGQPDLALTEDRDAQRHGRQRGDDCEAQSPRTRRPRRGYGLRRRGHVRARVTTLYARVGVAGLHIEVQRCEHLATKQLVPLEEYLVRIRAAANARALGSDIVLITRSDAAQSLGVAEAIAR
ncbi:Pyruvate/Phosphoenolpyruvate kinase-like domain-containing protein [Mycena pura]|uniref:Pyruvate/Phosphoenolpyruvate kinase-like domain-containing protein n=1 Tax=Mycena pura TaxID=153505 RepID=A0AAD6Y3X6_9AGAR|nr:Pyruvate/Phosphoenolpyruvate kinase-like domain-containing protein [Mycena pura]